MADISMCPANNCPLKDKCYRYRATSSKYQSWFMETPYDKDKENCNSYWDIGDRTDLSPPSGERFKK